MLESRDGRRVSPSPSAAETRGGCLVASHPQFPLSWTLTDDALAAPFRLDQVSSFLNAAAAGTLAWRSPFVPPSSTLIRRGRPRLLS